ncbi:MAG: type II secretory pathway pseudopilin PulG [Rickettsiales bacterium]|jgi:type II secretory pathway pseudopilin PulG
MKKIHNKKANTILEFAVVTLIVAGVIAASMSVSRTVISGSEEKITKERMEVVEETIKNYVATNKRLPCPASLTVAKGNATYGNEIGAEGDCSEDEDEDSAYGMIPTKILNLSDDMAEDGWGTKFTYVVDKNFTKTSAGVSGEDGFELTKSSPTQSEGENAKLEMIDVRSSGASLLPNNNGIFVLISHGANKFGGYPANGTKPNNEGTAEEIENSHLSGKIFISSSNDPNFDDIVKFSTKAGLVRDAELESIMCNASEADSSGECAGYTWDNTQYGNEVCSYYNVSYCKRICGKYGVWGSAVNVGQKCNGEKAPTVSCPLSAGDDYGDQTYEGDNGIFPVDYVANLTPESGFCGSPTITCLDTGSWSAPVTNSANECCTIVLNETLGSNVKSSYNQEVIVGDDVAVSCFTNYTGDPEAKCIEGGTPGNVDVTSGCSSTCIVSSSVNLNSSVKSNNYTQEVAVGSSVSVVCRIGYSGSPTATCTSGGTPGTITVNSSCSPNQCSQNFSSYGYANVTTTAGRAISGTEINCKSGHSTDSHPHNSYYSVSCSNTTNPVFSTPSQCRPNCSGYLGNSIFYGISGMFDGTGHREGGVQWTHSSVRFSQYLYGVSGTMANGTSQTVCRYSYEGCGVNGCFKRSKITFKCYNGAMSVTSEVRANLSCPSYGVSEVGSFYWSWTDNSGQLFNNANGVIY